MKLSLIKLPALFGVLYAAFTAIVLIVASGYAVTKGFSTAAVGTTLMNWEPHWWYLSILGGALHLLSFIKSRSRRLLIANTIGICLFIGYALIPNYALVLLVIHVIVIQVMAKTPVHPTSTANEVVS
ncbi:hypothetical protein [Lacticaseibacillus sp. N501-2]|uniref:hypothetical protein n=1 Tax=Lacticaseibacillus salsurae TaxID=3367729 RepID=UPI0038B37822